MPEDLPVPSRGRACRLRASSCCHPLSPHAELREQVKRQKEEKKHALEGLDRRTRQPDPGLCCVATDVGQPDEQACKEDANGIEPPKEGQDDRGETLTHIEAVSDLP